MIFLSSVILKLVWLLAFAALPGLCFLRWLDFRYRSRLDLVLAVFATGIPLAGCGVYVLLLANFYYAATAWLIVLLPAGWLLLTYKRSGRWLPGALAAEDRPAEMPAVPPRARISRASQKKAAAPAELTPAVRTGALDGVAIFCCGFLLLMFFLEAATSPLHTWDAVVTWDKWADQWAMRSNLYHCTQGGYPQLLPMFSSLLYKTTGHVGMLPQEQYALHAFHPFLGLLLLLACVRAARLFELPAWGVLAAVFGFQTMHAIIPSGGADLMVTLWVLLAPLLYLAWQKGEWNARWRGSPVLMACIFGAAFSKATGLFAILPLLLAGIRRPAAGVRFLPKPALAGLLGLPLLLLVPFYLAQYASSQEPLERMNTQEVNFRMRPAEMEGGFQNSIEAAYSSTAGWVRFREATRKFLTDYSLPQPFTNSAPIVPGLLLLAMAAAGAGRRPFGAVLITAIAILAVWYRMASYDQRNLLPALPLLGLCAAAGAVRLLTWLKRFSGAQFVLAGMVGFFAITIGSGIVAEASAVAESTLLRDNLTARLTAAEASFPQSAAPFFPQECEIWDFLSRQGFLRQARHTMAVSMFYRWVSSGIYAASDWNQRIVEPGDLFIGPPGKRPPGDYNRWSKLRTFGRLEIFLADRQPIAVPLQKVALTGASPPKLSASSAEELDAEAGGNQSMLACNLADRETRAGFSVVWQATVQAEQPDPAVQPCSLLYNPGIADPALSATSIDFNQAGDRIVKYSGVLAIRPGELSQNLNDEILFGICRSGAPQRLKLRGFRYSVYRW